MIVFCIFLCLVISDDLLLMNTPPRRQPMASRSQPTDNTKSDGPQQNSNLDRIFGLSPTDNNSDIVSTEHCSVSIDLLFHVLM